VRTFPMPDLPVDLQAVRRIAITALFSDDVLFDKIVLKGGNALNLALEISDRTSLDLDFSIENDFEDLDDVRQRILVALQNRFGSARLVVFDFKFEKKPHVPREGVSPRWGGYVVQFKLMGREKHGRLVGNIEAIRRDSLVVGPNNQRIFSIDFSKCEYVKGKREIEIDDYKVYVYSAEMIAIEKLRAICQQMPEYSLNRTPTARARDFYDIHLVVTKTRTNLASSENLALSRHIFAAKEVPLSLLRKIADYREFHRPDWDSVRASAKGELQEFDDYFDFVVAIAASMKSLWNE
jgi:predicted nucleotidyltransferase component of viral defense system